jgi:hypothetical protein
MGMVTCIDTMGNRGMSKLIHGEEFGQRDGGNTIVSEGGVFTIH